jgi:hypothetical protein
MEDLVMSSSKDPIRRDWYFKEPGQDQALARELEDIKRSPVSFDRNKWIDQDKGFLTDPSAGEGPKHFELAEKLAQAEPTRQKKLPPSLKKTLYDPDNLSLLLNKLPEDFDVQHITGSEIEALKDNAKKQQNPEVRLRQAAANVIRSMTTTMSGIFHSAKKNRQCELYGHIPEPAASWRAGLPKCIDCGVLIESRAQIRTHSATEQQRDIKPYDNKLDL